MIIGLTGGMVSGKFTMAQVLKEKGFIPLAYSTDVIDVELKKRGIPITRKSEQDLGNEIRQKEGPGSLSKRLLQIIDRNKDYVLDGIRNPGEVEVLRKEKDFVLIAIDSSKEQRFKRIIERNMERDPKTWEEFLKADARDFDDGTLNGLQIAKCMKLADFKILNDGSVEEFKKKIQEVLDKIYRKLV